MASYRICCARGMRFGKLTNQGGVWGCGGMPVTVISAGRGRWGSGRYVNDRRKPERGNLSASQKQRNRRHSRVRARVAHVFRIIKCQSSASSAVRLSSPKTEPFGYRQVRYKGLAKNRAQVMSRVALANISVEPVVDGRLTGELRPKGTKGVRKPQKARCSVLTRDQIL